jgi:hypothetical protein
LFQLWGGGAAQHGDFAAVGKQALDQPAAKETRAAGDQYGPRWGEVSVTY